MTYRYREQAHSYRGAGVSAVVLFGQALNGEAAIV